MREPSGLTPEELAVDGTRKMKAIKKYESGKSELPVSVLMHYWRLSDVPLENILNDDAKNDFGLLRQSCVQRPSARATLTRPLP
jgi:hypothetical protein